MFKETVMKLHQLATGLFLVLGLVVTALAADKKDVDKEKLLGKWECTEGPEHIKGTTGEFLKDGKGKFTHKDKDGNETMGEFTYALDGDKLKVTHKDKDGNDVTESIKITKLTDKELVTETDTGEVAKFKRK
jgi:uncharacterized protein (TIGR03066 family)